MVDIIVLAILAICAFWGYQKGLLRMIISVVASVLTILVAIVISPYVNNFVKENTDIYPKVEASIQVQLESYTTEYLENIEAEQQGNFIESLGLPKAIESMILENNTAEYYAQQGVSTFTQYLSTIITNIAISTAIFVISYLVVFILIRIVFLVIKIVDYIPFVREANNTAGMILCLAQALLIIWVLCLVATPFSAVPLGQWFNGLIEESKVLQILYQYNPLVVFF